VGTRQCYAPSILLCPTTPPRRNLPSSPQHDKHLAFQVMPHPHPTASSSLSSSNFQLIINNALKAYEKRTKSDLFAHPLASQLQACNTPDAILVVLQQQVQELDHSRSSDDRWTQWLGPTVNILYSLCGTLGEGVSLVSLRS
jgi:hypothetical protein